MVEITKNIGKTKIFENDQITMWSFELEVGEETPMHRHENKYLWYAIKGQPLDCEDAEGNDLGIFDVKDGDVFEIDYIGNEQLKVLAPESMKGVLYPATHKAKNVGDDKYVEILIEFK